MSAPAGKPVVFLDVDGPLIPFGASRQELPDGYPEFGTGFDNPLLARIDPRLGTELRRLPADLVWATTWGEDANAVIGPLLGLERLPVVAWTDGTETEIETQAHGVHWKLAPILAFARGRRFVWIDDEISTADQNWVEASRSEPSLLHRVDPRFGLRDDDFRQVTLWLSSH